MSNEIAQQTFGSETPRRGGRLGIWLPFLNTETARTVPAYGIIEAHDYAIEGASGEPILHCRRPTMQEEFQYPKYVNGPFPVLPKARGECTKSGIFVARAGVGLSTAEFQSLFCAEVNSFDLRSSQVPPTSNAFKYLGGKDTTNSIGIFEYGTVDCGGSKWIVESLGGATTGTFALFVDDAVSGADFTVSVDWDETADSLETKLEAELGVGNVFCSCGPLNEQAIYILFSPATTIDNLEVTSMSLNGGIRQRVRCEKVC